MLSHAEALAALDEASLVPAVFVENERVARLLYAWRDAVLDHSGTVPVTLQDDEWDDDAADDDAEDGDELISSAASTPLERLSVVTRFDLEVVDADALLAAGRAAEEEHGSTPAAAEQRVQSAALALQAWLHSQEPDWLDLPGIEPLKGVRAYVRPETHDLPGHPLDARVVAPESELAFAETWSSGAE